MPRVTTRQASDKIQTLSPFTTNGSLWAARETGGPYTVYSYGTAIATINETTGEATLNRKKYSVTTSRHQGIVGYGVQRFCDLHGLEVTETH